jgi:hypothetical protein
MPAMAALVAALSKNGFLSLPPVEQRQLIRAVEALIPGGGVLRPRAATLEAAKLGRVRPLRNPPRIRIFAYPPSETCLSDGEGVPENPAARRVTPGGDANGSPSPSAADSTFLDLAHVALTST